MKNILACVSGLSPQIITETLYALSVNKKIRIDEIVVITTLTGKKLIEGKIPYDIKGKKVKIKLSDKIDEMCKLYKIKKPKISSDNLYTASEESLELNDIRSDKDNKLFPNKVCSVIQDLTKDNENVVYASVSGGRKTMSVFMGFAMSLYGRNKDKLYHVLTTEENEKNREFFFPLTNSKSKEIELSEIPFIKLRNIIKEKLGKKTGNYNDLVQYTQNELMKISDDKLYIDTRRREIWFGKNDKIRIEPKQIDLYRYFIENKGNSENPIHINALINNFKINKRTGEEIKKYDETNIRQMITKLNNNCIKPSLKDYENMDLFVVHSGAYARGEYFVNASGNNVIFID